ncbi:MAG: MlaE family lipid ABC transporter permease subunit [Pseudomonadota bacterium]|jgi:phospholipid/cholesterol/gamma-HCH transport system permease protein|nr:MlaE family lipid ABC transporter permease subunit [Pseudomonadota bacterium]
MASTSIRREQVGAHTVFRLSGDWTTNGLAVLEDEVGEVVDSAASATGPLTVDAAGIDALDSNGAWLLSQIVQAFEQRGAVVEWTGLNEHHQPLFEQIRRSRPIPQPPRQVTGILRVIEHCGEAVFLWARNSLTFISFLGLTLVRLLRAVTQPRRVRFTSLVHHLERTGIDSLPIVAMLSFLIGVVLAYMGGEQLKRLGAETFTVNLVAVAVLREMGILITAIIIAGRSGSAFTAQIGTMKVNQEIDAMNTIGLDPVEVLALPRVLALMISLPILTFFADLMGLFGGAVIAVTVLDMNIPQFIRQLSEAVELNHFMVGMVKAPLFGFIIALVGCYEGLRVSASAESVGQQTTRSVVESIALVIALDTLFVVFFSIIGI